jgi:Na+/H+ antiporter NhaC
MLAIGIPMAQTLEANVYLTIAAALGGGVFGDHCSPISDTTIISSMASASDHIDHVKTQLPYALTAGVISALLYLILGIIIH